MSFKLGHAARGGTRGADGQRRRPRFANPPAKYKTKGHFLTLHSHTHTHAGRDWHLSDWYSADTAWKRTRSPPAPRRRRISLFTRLFSQPNPFHYLLDPSSPIFKAPVAPSSVCEKGVVEQAQRPGVALPSSGGDGKAKCASEPP